MMKKCYVCKSAKELCLFSKDRTTASGIGSVCMECSRAKAKAYRLSHPARAALARANWRRANPEAVAAQKRRDGKKNSARYVARAVAWNREHPVERALANATWAANNRPKRAAAYAKYRSAKKSATPKWADHETIREYYEFAALKTKLTGRPWHVDHIVPLVSPLVCGLHTDYNLQVLAGPANSAKGNRYWPDMP